MDDLSKRRNPVVRGSPAGSLTADASVMVLFHLHRAYDEERSDDREELHESEDDA